LSPGINDVSLLSSREYYFTVDVSFLFSPPNVRAASADRRHTLPRDRKVLPFDNLGPNIFGRPYFGT